MSRRIDKSWLVFASIENPQHDRCVDLFRRPDGTYGFEEFRRDPEDGGAWTPVRFFSGAVHASSTDAFDAAAKAVAWFAEEARRRPECARDRPRHRVRAMPIAMDGPELEAFLRDEFPESQANVTVKVDAVGEGRITVRAVIDQRHLRPGGTVSGPTMMWLADCATYLLILSQIGRVAMAVTTNLNINFLRKGEAGRDLIGEARLLKLGQRLAVAEMSIFSDGLPEPIAHVTLTYSIPPRGVK